MGGTIFISYRRDQDAGSAGRLFDRLEKRTFRRKLFMDVDSIAPGQDFESILKARVAECDVLLALIGRGWLTATDEAGRRRLYNAKDLVRVEIATALTQAKHVIPVLIDDVPMPRPEDLPEELKPLVRLQATRLSHERFETDSGRLIRALKQVLADAELKDKELKRLRQCEKDLANYPRGPAVEGTFIPHSFIQEVADAFPIHLISDLVTRANGLRKAVDPRDPSVTVIRPGLLVTNDTAYAYWLSVFHEARLNSPRMLAALLMVLPIEADPLKQKREILLVKLKTISSGARE